MRYFQNNQKRGQITLNAVSTFLNIRVSTPIMYSTNGHYDI